MEEDNNNLKEQKLKESLIKFLRIGILLK